MKTVLVWILIGSGHAITYSPPMVSVEDCKRMQQNIISFSERSSSQCVQINMVVN